MIVPKKKEFNLKEFKLTNAQGAHVVWNYMFPKGNAGHMDEPSIKRTLVPHDDLLNKLKLMKEMVMKSEDIDYARNIMKIPGLKPSKEMEQAVEGSILDIKSKIDVTGIKLSGKDDKRNAVITYKKVTGNKKVMGRATSAITLSGNIYGFEQELEELIEDFIKEVYEYLYEDKYQDMEQAELYPSGAFDKKEDKKPAESKKKPAANKKAPAKKQEPIVDEKPSTPKAMKAEKATKAQMAVA